MFFLRELQHHALQLQILGLRHVGYKANKSERLLFCLGEGGGLVERWVVEQFDSALGSASHVRFLSFFFLIQGL